MDDKELINSITQKLWGYKAGEWAKESHGQIYSEILNALYPKYDFSIASMSRGGERRFACEFLEKGTGRVLQTKIDDSLDRAVIIAALWLLQSAPQGNTESGNHD